MRSSLKVGKLPPLTVVELDSLLLHEDHDVMRFERLRQRMASDGYLKNPPIAARDHGGFPHLLLDGANRVGALRDLGARFVVIQEVDLADKDLVLSTWHHVVEGMAEAALLEGLAGVGRLTPVDAALTADGDFIPHFNSEACCVVLSDGRAYGVGTGADAAERAAIARQVTGLVSVAAQRDRVSYTNLPDLRRHYPAFSALVCYQPFSKADVMRFAVEKRKLPGGITRFSVPKRALSLFVPLHFLAGNAGLAEKQAALEEIIAEKIKEQRIRFYAEPTFHFDD